MMTCETYQEIVAAHVDDSLAADEQREVESHLAGCAKCSSLSAQEQAFFSAFSNRQIIIPVPQETEQQLRTALKGKEGSSLTLGERFRAWPMPELAQPRLAWGTALASLLVIVSLLQLLVPSSAARLPATATSY